MLEYLRKNRNGSSTLKGISKCVPALISHIGISSGWEKMRFVDLSLMAYLLPLLGVITVIPPFLPTVERINVLFRSVILLSGNASTCAPSIRKIISRILCAVCCIALFTINTSFFRDEYMILLYSRKGNMYKPLKHTLFLCRFFRVRVCLFGVGGLGFGGGFVVFVALWRE